MAGDQVVCPFFEIVFERLNSLINKDRKELGPLVGLVEELKRLYKTFLKIKDVLSDAEQKELKEDAVQFWLQELNDAVYKARNVLNEFEYEGRQKLASEEGQQFYGKVQKFIEIFHDLAKVCLELELEKGNEKSVVKSELEKLKEKSVLTSPDHRTDSLLTESQVYGRDEVRKKLVKKLLHGSGRNIYVICIQGIGGLGKTTLAQLVYNDEQVKNHFEVRSWVSVSDNFNIKHLAKVFVASVSGSECDIEDIEFLQCRLQKRVHGKRFLLVLDDVWEEGLWEEGQEEWNKMVEFFKGGAQGSSIIVTTRDLNTRFYLCSALTSVSPHYLCRLSKKDCWAIFKQYAFGPGNEERPALVTIGKQIVKKCRGLPLAAKAMGGFLRFKNDEIEWNEAKDSWIWEIPQSTWEQCFVYCSILPKEYMTRKRRIDSISIVDDKLFIADSCKNRVGLVWESDVQCLTTEVLLRQRRGRGERDVPWITTEVLSRPGNRPRWPYLAQAEILGGEGKGARDRCNHPSPSRSETPRILKRTHPSHPFPRSLPPFHVEDVEKQKSVAAVQPNKQDLASIKVADIQSNKQDLASIKGNLDSRSPSSSSSAGWCICRVPTKFREVNEYAYTPEIISIGPFHRDKKELKGMEVHKLRYVNSLLSRFEDRATKLEECVEAISRLEDEARKCYSEPIELNKEEFVEMMIVDGLFIIELFSKNAGEGQIDKDDPVFNNVWGLASLVRDLILLENQLPMLVLERLFNITMASQQGGKRLSELAIRFFNPLMQREETVLAKYFETGGDHLLDILSKTFYDFPSQQLPHGVKSVQVPVPSVLMKRVEIVVERAPSQGEISTSSMVKSGPELEFKDVPSLTELRDSGVKFKKGNNTFSFLNINFCNGVIEIPPILIQDQNFSFIRNVIAYEQGLVGHSAHMTSYVVLMNNIIQTSNDVAFLREHGIIRNYLSDDELVSSQFQKLHNEINLANFHHSKLCIDVNAFRVTYIQKATSVLKNVYRRVVPTRWVLLAAGLFLTFDAFKLTLATTECTPDLYIFNWQRLDFLSHVLLGIILIVMFWCDSY